MRYRDRMAVILVATLTCSAGAVRRSSPKASKDAQSSYELRSGPGAGQKYLEAFVGEWDVVKTFYPRSGGAVPRAGDLPPDDDPRRPVPSIGVRLRTGRPQDIGAGSHRLRSSDGPLHHRLDRFSPDPDVVPAEPRAIRRKADRPVQPVVG